MKKHFLLFGLGIFGFFGVSAQCVKKIDAGTYHTTAILEDNSLMVWGNVFQNLGEQTVVGTFVNPAKFGEDNDWKEVSGGRYYTVAIKLDGSLWAWGNNEKGQLGDPAISNVTYSPVRIGNDDDWKTISAGLYHTIAIKEDGSLWGWGENGNNEAGGAIRGTNVLTPQRIGLDNDWESADAGHSYSLAIKTDGTLWIWGFNSGESENSNVNASPVQVGTDNDWSMVSVGGSFVLALKKDGSLWGWGFNQYGQLGLNDPLTSFIRGVTQLSPLSHWKSVTAGGTCSIAMAEDNSIWVCGTNLGTGSTVRTSDTPVPERLYEWTQKGTATDWEDFSIGHSHYAVLNNKGEVSTWGYNVYNQVSPGYYYIVDPYAVPLNCPTVTSTDNKTAENSDLHIYPNPFMDLININNSEGTEITKAELVNSQGQLKLVNLENNTLNTSALSKGIYILKISNSNGKSYSRKIVKE
jgi:alpha-tubulin suppressor-like RCC1 family protein